MATFVFDFDSTLIPGESLEDAFRFMNLDEEALIQISDIANQGMAGELPFKESLERRLKIARPHRSALEGAGALVTKECTKGAKEMVAQMHRDGHEVWIVSGGFKDLILVAATEWGIPEDRVHAIGVEWDADGNFVSVIEDGHEIGKVEGLTRAGISWDSPSFMIGDGVTDFKVRDAGLTDQFLAYIEHAQRPVVIEEADHLISNMLGLRLLMTEIL